jgi:hypothetical protein
MFNGIISALNYGIPLEECIRKQLKLHFNTDLSKVRIHTDGSAHELAKKVNAIAFTTGNHIFFQTGKYNPDSSAGFELLAHETAHTIQQSQGLVSAGIDSSPSLESAAQLEGQKAVANKSVLEQKSNTLRDFMGFPKPLEPKESSTPVNLKNIQRSLENPYAIQRLQTSKSWRETGNLKGNPPVRDEKNPPNKNIVEDEKTYFGLLSSVRAVHKKQIARAESMTSKTGFVKDYRYWFTKVYGFVTQNILEFTVDKTFYYPTAVLLETLYFDKLFEDNLKASAAKQEVHWREAWKTAAQQQKNGQQGMPETVGIVFSLISSMLAHIRFDLPRALAWVMQDYNNKFGAKPTDLRSDFFSMSGVFDNATQQMFPLIQKALKANQETILGIIGEDDAVQQVTDRNWIGMAMRTWLNADMNLERLEAWERAEIMFRTGMASNNPYTLNSSNQLQGNVTNGNHQGMLGNVQPSLNGIGNNTLPQLARGADGVLRTGATDPMWDVVGGALSSTVSDAQIQGYSLLQASRIIFEFLKGGRLLPDTASDFIVRIIKGFEQKGGLVPLMDAVNAHDVLEQMGEGIQKTTSEYLRKNYYPNTTFNTVYSQILRWIANPTSIGRSRSIRHLYESRNSADRILIEKRLQEAGFPTIQSLIKES